MLPKTFPRSEVATTPFRRRATGLVGVGLALALPVALALPASSAAAAGTGATGAFADAYGLSIDTTLLAGNVPVVVPPQARASNSCLPQKAPVTTQVLGAGDPQVARADVLTSGAGTSCANGTAKAMSQVTNLDALKVAAPAALHADLITSVSNSSCTVAPNGSTRIANLTIGGTAVPLPTDVPPNFDVLPAVLGPLGLRIIANEQHPAANGRGFVVNGLHIIASATGAALPVGGSVLRGDVIIAHAVTGVTCANGAGTTAPASGSPGAPDIRFTKTASPTTAKAGERVTYTATVTNTSTTPCEVLRFIDHVSPAFSLVSTSGPFGATYDSPAPVRPDGGQEAVLRPAMLTIPAKGSSTQTFVVTVKAATSPGTYFNNLEVFCGQNGDFVSGPLAPVTIPAVVIAVTTPVAPVAAPAPAELPHTGLPTGPAAVALTLLAGTAVLVRRRRTAE